MINLEIKNPSKRLFLQASIACAIAPAIVKAANIMPIKAQKIWAPNFNDDFTLEVWDYDHQQAAFCSLRFTKSIARYTLSTPPVREEWESSQRRMYSHFAIQRDAIFKNGVYESHPSDQLVRHAETLVKQYLGPLA